MRWNLKPKKPAKEGDTKEVRRFLFLPLVIGSDVRWLETAVVRYECYYGYAESGDFKVLKWRPVEFLN